MVKSLKLFLLVILGVIAMQSNAQVTVDIDEKINEQLRMKNALIDSNNIHGYRIQISSSTSRSTARTDRIKFVGLFPDYSNRVHEVYQQPYWKIRVGDFYREIDAQGLLNEIRIYFPKSFLVKDKIKRPKI